MDISNDKNVEKNLQCSCCDLISKIGMAEITRCTHTPKLTHMPLICFHSFIILVYWMLCVCVYVLFNYIITCNY